MEKYYIWLILALGEGEPEINRLLKSTGSAKAAYEAVIGNTAMLGAGLTERAEKTKLETAEKTVDRITNKGYKIITYDSPYYPARLKKTENPPCVLFAEGSISLLKKQILTVVGSRAVTPYTESVIPRVIKDIGKGYAIAGTLSEGCDQLTCMNAIRYGVPFIEVMPCGLAATYPTGSRTLRKFLLANGGLLITEFLPKERAAQGNFLRRSRILGGISYVTLVFQAGEKSGALATAEYSSAPLFLPPHDVFVSDYSGAVNAVRNGAKLYYGSEDIDAAIKRAEKKEKAADEGTEPPAEKPKFRNIKKKTQETKSGSVNIKPEPPDKYEAPPKREVHEDYFETPEHYTLYKKLEELDKPVGTEELLTATGMDIDKLTELLLDLEIEGFIHVAGGRYKVT